MIVIKSNNYTEDEIRMLYDYLLNLDNEIVFSYYCNNNIRGYENDFIFFIEIINDLIKIYEEVEEYEKCNKLKTKKIESEKMINKEKVKNYGSIWNE